MNAFDLAQQIFDFTGDGEEIRFSHIDAIFIKNLPGIWVLNDQCSDTGLFGLKAENLLIRVIADVGDLTKSPAQLWFFRSQRHFFVAENTNR